MTVGLNVCLSYCATSYTEDATTKTCVHTNDMMFDLQVSRWSKDFRVYLDIVNNIAVQMGANPAYEDDDPTITNLENGIKEFYFDGIDDFIQIQDAEVGRSGLLLHHTMTIQAWIYIPEAPSSSQVLLSKIDASNH